MNLRTSNIILINKGNHIYLDEKGNKLNPKDAIKRYMSITCACPEEDYTDARLLGIIQSVVLDYLKTSNQPEQLIRDYFEWSNVIMFNHYVDQNDIDAWLTALREIQVRRGDDFINGFNEYNTKCWDENTDGETLLFPEED